PARAGIAADPAAGAERIAAAFASGAAAERFDRMVAALGGPVGFLDAWEQHLTRAPLMAEVTATEAGFVTAIDGRELGYAVIELGGGRRRACDLFEHRVGRAARVRCYLGVMA